MKKILIVLVSIFLVGCSSNPKGIDIEFIEGAEFAKDSDVNSCTLIKSINGEEVSIEKSLDLFVDINGDRLSCEELDTSKVGNQKILFNYKKQIFEVEYTVVDKEAPRIVGDEDIYLEPGEEFDIERYIQFIDNDYAEGVVSGYLDVNSEGIYELTLQCTDKSNNYVEKKVNVHVGDSTKVISTTEQNKEEAQRNEVYAERLIAQLEVLEKEQEEKIKEENKVITQEQIEEATKVYDPTCQLGEYEVEAPTALEAAMIAMNLYGCWHVEVELIPEPDSTPVPEAPPEVTEQPIEEELPSTETPENPEGEEPVLDPTPSPEPTKEPEPIPTLEPRIPKFKVKCICTVNGQRYQGRLGS